MADRRLKLLRFDMGLSSIAPLLRGEISTSGMPADAEVQRCGYDPNTDSTVYIVHSDTFDEVPIGTPLPWLDIMCEKRDVTHGS